jgi:hypothetical protein
MDYKKQTFTLAILTLSIALCSCATSSITDKDSQISGADVESILLSGDEKKIDAIISKSPSAAERFVALNAIIESKECASKAMQVVFNRNPSKLESQYKSELSFLKEMSGKKDIYIPTQLAATLISKSVRTFCADELEVLYANVNPEDFAIGIGEVEMGGNNGYGGKTFVAVFKDAATSDNPDNELTPMIKVLEFVGASLKKDCSNKVSKSCDTQAKFKSAANYAAKIEDNRIFNNSADGILESACESYLAMQKKYAYIAEEKEKGRISGYVNVSYLKEWGDQAYHYKKEFNEYNEQYKAKTKKNINPKEQCR